MPPTLKNVDVRVCLAVIVKTPEVEKNRRQKRGKRGDIIWLAYAIIANTRHAIAVNPVDSPSSPSVRFMAFEVAMIMIIIRGI